MTTILPIKAVRDYDNLELKAVIDVIATFCLTDDTGRCAILSRRPDLDIRPLP